MHSTKPLATRGAHPQAPARRLATPGGTLLFLDRCISEPTADHVRVGRPRPSVGLRMTLLRQPSYQFGNPLATYVCTRRGVVARDAGCSRSVASKRPRRRPSWNVQAAAWGERRGNEI